jgi:hypothetical protein
MVKLNAAKIYALQACQVARHFKHVKAQLRIFAEELKLAIQIWPYAVLVLAHLIPQFCVQLIRLAKNQLMNARFKTVLMLTFLKLTALHSCVKMGPVDKMLAQNGLLAP